MPDISRNVRPVEHSLLDADWAISGKESGIVGLGVELMEQFVLNAVRASLLQEPARWEMERQYRDEFARLRAESQL